MTPARPFLVNLAALRGSGSRHHVVRSGRLADLAVTSSAVPPDGEVTVDADLDIVDGGVVVTGTVAAPWVGECRRCLRPVRSKLVADVLEVYERTPRLRSGEEDDDDEVDTYPLLGDVVDLAPLARDAVLLELPLAPLCRPDCAGLCPTCGAELSEGPCGCPDAATNPLWAALDGLGLEGASGGPDA